jgi:hypothetical protein
MIVIGRKSIIISSLIIGGVIMTICKINNIKKVEIEVNQKNTVNHKKENPVDDVKENPVDDVKENPVDDVKEILYIDVDSDNTDEEDTIISKVIIIH